MIGDIFRPSHSDCEREAEMGRRYFQAGEFHPSRERTAIIRMRVYSRVDCRRELRAACWWAVLGGIVLGAWLALVVGTLRGWAR